MFVVRRFFQFLLFAVLMGMIYASGAYVLPDYSTLVPATPPPPPVYIPEETDPVYTELGAPAVIEYGEMCVINNNNDPFHAYIRYPQAGNPSDEYIYNWAQDLFDDMNVGYSTGIEFNPADFGEMNVHFNSYLIDNRYAGIHQFGEYSYTTTGLPSEIIKTFNIDLTEFRLLEPGDVFDLEQYADSVLSLMRLRMLVEHPKTDGYIDFMDERWLSCFYIAHDGIKIILPHNEFLPDSFETLTVTLPYADLGMSLLIRRDAPLPVMPTPMPEPAPAPEPMPGPAPDPDGDDSDGGDGDASGGEDGDGGDGDASGGEDADGGDGDASGGEGVDSEDGDASGGEDGEVSDGNGEDGDATGGEDSDSEDDANVSGEEPAPDVPKQGKTADRDRPAIALTFDDGPGTYMDELLDILEQYGARATFFTVGNIADTRAEILQRAVDIDCEVAGHSWNHKNLAKMNADDVGQQLETTNSAIEAITGIAPSVFRPPYGAVSDTMKTVSEEMGLSMIKWNTDSEDWKNKDADEIYEIVMSRVEDRAIILSHDVYEPVLEAYKRIIPELLIDGYQILTASELVKLEYMRLTPGLIYYSGHRVEQVG